MNTNNSRNNRQTGSYYAPKKNGAGKLVKWLVGGVIALEAVAICVCGGVIVNLSRDCEHEWNAGEITLESTCTHVGEKTYTCTKCGDTKVVELEKLEHSVDKTADTRVKLVYGNDYLLELSERTNRVTIQPYAIEIPKGVTLRIKDGYAFSLYILDNVNEPTSAVVALSWTTGSFSPTGGYSYGITIKKTDNSDFDLTAESVYVSDYIESSDPSIWNVVTCTICGATVDQNE